MAKLTQSTTVASVTATHESSLEEMLALWPPLSDVQREAFRAQFGEARCDLLGQRTKSAAVLTEATSLARVVDKVVHRRRQGATLRRYGAARLAWMLECIISLRRCRDEQLASKDAPAKSVDAATLTAIKVRSSIAHVLELLIGDDTIDAMQLAEAKGTGKKPEQTMHSLRALAKLGEQWLRHTDGETRALVSSVDLRQGDVDQAWAAALDIEHALDRASGKPRNVSEDTARIDRIEGRVLLEMRYAMAAFAFAHEIDAAIPLLASGDATRAVIDA